ncbi:MAG TPA: hypothetical protein PKN75_03775 [Bacteroidia bacterium]|nr:hypothetical protein [Bacteroidia bacterium]HNU32689.1 hypothetical protein [Bacteroidia bacterium]
MYSTDDRINKLVGEKAPITSLVMQNVIGWFEVFKNEIQKLSNRLKTDFDGKVNNVVIQYQERGERQFSLRVGEDLIYFHLQSNVFKLDDAHSLYRSAYLKDDPYNAYCGIICVYNFLSDSITKSRESDQGFLIARIFINRENHFYVEGKKQIGLIHNDFINDVIDANKVSDMVKTFIVFAMEHDLIPAPFDMVQSVTVSELQSHNFSSSLATGKSLGFRMQKDDNQSE